MILTTADETYIPKAKTLIQSCARHAPDQLFYLYLINVDKTRDREIYAWHPNIVIEHVDWDYKPHRWRGLLCSARSIPLFRSLQNYKENVVYLDADTIVRHSPVDLFAILDDHHLTVKYRPRLNHLGPTGTLYASKFNSGVIGIQYSELGVAFAKRYNEILWNFNNSGRKLHVDLINEKIVTYPDQELLFVAYLEFQNKIKFMALPEGYNDSKFLPKSTIWHGKGTAYNHPIFRIERNRYNGRFRYFTFGGLNFVLQIARMIRNKFR